MAKRRSSRRKKPVASEQSSSAATPESAANPPEVVIPSESSVNPDSAITESAVTESVTPDSATPVPEPPDSPPLKPALSETSSSESSEPLAAANGAIEEEIAQLKQSVAHLQQLPEAIQLTTGSIVSLSEQLATVQQGLEDLAARPEPVAADLAPLETTIAQLRQDLDNLAEQQPAAEPSAPVDLEPLETAIASLQPMPEAIQLNTASIASLGEQLAELQQSLKSVASRPVPETTDLAPIETAIADIRSEVESLTRQAGETERVDLTPLETAIASLQPMPEAIQLNTSSIASLGEQLSSLQQGLEELAASPEPETVDLAPLEEAIATVRIEVEALSRQSEAAEPVDLEPLETAIASLQPMPEAIQLNTSSIASLSEQLADIQQGLETVTARPEPEIVDLAPLETAVADIRSEVESLTRQASERESVDLAPLETAIASLEPMPEAIQLNTSSIASLSEQLAAVREGLEEIANRPEPEAVDLAPLETAIAALQQMPEAIQLNTGSIASLSEQLSDLQQGLAEIAARPEPEAVDLAPLEATLSDQKAVLANLETRLETLTPSHRTEELNEAIGRIRTQIAQLEASPSVAETIADALQLRDANLDTLTTQLAEIETRLGEWETRPQVDPEAIAQLRQDVDEVNRKLEVLPAALEERLEPLSSSLYELKSTVTPLEQQLPEAIRYNTQSAVSLQEQLDRVEEQYGQLQQQLQELRESGDRDRQAAATQQESLQNQIAQLSDRVPSDMDELRSALGQLQPQLQQLEASLASKADSSERQSDLETLQEVQSTLAQIQEKIPEAIGYNTQSIVTLQSSFSELGGQVQERLGHEGTITQDMTTLKTYIETLAVRQRTQQLWLFSSLGVAIVAIMTAFSNIIHLPFLGG